MKQIRLDKFISDNTDYTRSEIKSIARKGQIEVNSGIVKDTAFKIDPETDTVEINSIKVVYKEFVYLCMNKPKGILTACTDKTRQTVLDLIPEKYKHYNLFPVGRLDKDTTGLLILTNNGNFAHKVISPKSGIEKSYIAVLDGNITANMCEIFKSGVVLADGTVCKPAILEAIDENTARIIICEGKYHQIKRMFGAVGLGVNNLHRERIGNLILPNNLKSGECIEISQKQFKNIV